MGLCPMCGPWDSGVSGQARRCSLQRLLRDVARGVGAGHLTSIFHFVSFRPNRVCKSRRRLHVRVGCIGGKDYVLRPSRRDVAFHRKRVVVAASSVDRLFRTKTSNAALVRLRFLPRVFSRFDLGTAISSGNSTLAPIFLFSRRGELVGVMGGVQVVHMMRHVIGRLRRGDSCCRCLIVVCCTRLLVLVCHCGSRTCLPVYAGRALGETVTCVHLGCRSRVGVGGMTRRANVDRHCLEDLFSRCLGLSPLSCLGRVEVGGTIRLLHGARVSVGRMYFRYKFRSPRCFSHVFGRRVKIAPHRVAG